MNKKNKKIDMKYHAHFAIRFIIGLGINIALILLFCVPPLKELCLSIAGDLADDINRFDLLFTQISVSFILISLVSVLSTTTNIVYWVDVSQYKLVKPKYTGFIDYASYILACLAVSVACVLWKSNYVLIPFLYSIVLLAFLTIKMLGSYFARDSVKKELHDKFLVLKKNDISEYNRNRNILVENTYKEITSKDYKLIEENIELLMDSHELEKIITIMEYIGDDLPDLFCNLLKRYDNDLCSGKNTVKEKYYQMLSSNLVKFIIAGRMSSFAIDSYRIYLKARVNQINQAIENYNGLKSDEKDFKKGEKMWLLIKSGDLDIDRYGLGRIYSECIKYDRFELLDDFLSAYDEQLTKIGEIIRKYYPDLGFAERLKQIYLADMEIKQIIADLVKKVGDQEIDGRQINILLRRLIDIYSRIEMIEREEINGKRGKDFDKLSSESLKDSYIKLIETTAEADMLTAYTYYSRIHKSSDFIKNQLEKFRKKVIDTV